MKSRYDRERSETLKQSSTPDKAYNKVQLKKGMGVEKEHSNNPYTQKSIAKAHLKENPNYYKYYDGKGREYLVSEDKKKAFVRVK